MKRDYFEGWYYKHQAGGRTLALIPGRADDGAFVQVVTDRRSYHIPYPLAQYVRESDCLRIGGNLFTPHGVHLDLHGDGLSLRGTIHYRNLTPIRGDIMGPFRLLPMECRHGVLSMRHDLSGSVQSNGDVLDFTGGVGYIEADCGHSFPKSYSWIQANDFGRDCSIMAAVADIPLMGLRFRGCICIVSLKGREYRLATYRGATVLHCGPDGISLRQGRYRLDIRVEKAEGCALSAPRSGAMSRMIKETAACPAHFRLTEGNAVLFKGRSEGASHEYVPGE